MPCIYGDKPTMSAGTGRDERAIRWTISGLSLAVILAVAAVLFRSHGSTATDSPLPALNALLNATSAILLSIGYACIRRRRVAAHRACMTTAFGVSALFLIGYLIHHAQ